MVKNQLLEEGEDLKKCNILKNVSNIYNVR